MSKLYYKINLEEFFDSDDDYREYHNHLPHFKQLKDWLPKKWAECHIEQTFSMKEIRENIESCILTVRQGKDGEAYAMVTINFKPGFRLSARRRESVWDDLKCLTDSVNAWITIKFRVRRMGICCICKIYKSRWKHELVQSCWCYG